jgi:hypothetical protein
MLKNGQLPAFRVGSDWRFHREKIDQYLFAASNVVQTERAQNDGDKPVAASRPEKTVAPDREVWAAKQAQALRERRVEALDWDNLSRAIEILGRRGRSRRYPDVRELNVGLMPR